MVYIPADPIKSEHGEPILKLSLPDGVDFYVVRTNSCWDLVNKVGVAFSIREEDSQKETLLYLAEILEIAAKQIRVQNE